jgi:hypothetical protein
VTPADVVERVGQPCPVAGRPQQVETLFGVAEREPVLPAALGDEAQALMDVGLPRAVAELPVQLKGAGELGAGLMSSARRA